MGADPSRPNVSLSERKRTENSEVIFLDEGRSISGATLVVVYSSVWRPAFMAWAKSIVPS